MWYQELGKQIYWREYSNCMCDAVLIGVLIHDILSSWENGLLGNFNFLLVNWGLSDDYDWTKYATLQV